MEKMLASGANEIVPYRPNSADTEWTSQKSAELYGINYWGAGYFRINDSGNVEVTPFGANGSRVDLFHLVEDLRERGLRLPILLRFPDLIKARIELLTNCFAKSIQDYGYKGSYAGVYPIKVNQQRHLVEEIATFGQFKRLGLECGSKPELLVGLALLETPNALIICNGFKDQEYIETAILAQKLGRNIIVVVDRKVELEMIVAASRRLGIKPRIGFRCKLSAQGAGRWVESSGAKSKFGLTPMEIVEGVEYLKSQDMISALELLHFHIGSQIPSIQSIKAAVKEGVQFFTELYRMGAPLRYMDVGGGLGVDYDGSGRGDSSTNYSEQEYANDVVSIIQSICDERGVPHPDIVSESGRSLVAHSSVLIFDVLGVNKISRKSLGHPVTDKDSRLVQDLHEMYLNVNEKNLNEYYNDIIEKRRDTQQMFSYGVLSLEQLAKADELFHVITSKMASLVRKAKDCEDIRWELEREQCDTYFCNFSIFQSMPDSWAVGQTFPVMPLHRLKEYPSERCVLVDLTCDSDGKIDEFIDMESDQPQKYLEVHELKSDESYLMGVFLTGAYQETLGDLHNLFGDTDAVHITIKENGYSVDQVIRGDSVTEVLSYVQYNDQALVEKVRQACESSILRGALSRSEARLLMDNFEKGLAGYTYLQNSPS